MQLVYGLNTINITPGLKRRLNAFHMMSYMRSIDHSYYSHISNEEVIQRATMELNNADCLDLDWEHFCTDSLLRRDDFKTIKMVGDITEAVSYTHLTLPTILLV